MRIKTQLIITILVFAIALLAVATSAVITNVQIDKVTDQEMNASNIAQGANELSYLANDYVMYREQTQLGRWQSRYASFSSDVAKLRTDRPEQQALARNIQANQQRIKEVFDSVVAAAGTAPQAGTVDPAFLQVSWSRMAVQSQALSTDASRLAQLLRAQADRIIWTRSILIYSIVALLGLFILAIYLIVYRRALRSISTLQAGTTVIGSGNLDFKIEEKASDEIGDLSRAFNRMTTALKAVTASKTDLEREIDERKKAEEALKTSEEKFYKAFHSSPVGMAIARLADGLLIDVNDSYLRLLEFSREEVVGHRSVDLNIYIDIAQRAKIVQTVRETGMVLDYEIPLRTKTGRILTVLFSAEKITLNGEDHYIPSFYDITQRKQTEAEMAHLASFPELNPNPVLELDADGNIKYMNQAAKTHLPTLFTQGTRHQFLAGWEAIASAIENETAVVTRDVRVGDSWYLQTVSHAPPAGNFRIYARDITERKQAETQIRELADSIRQEQDRLTALVSSIPDEVWFADTNKNFTLANQLALHEFGTSGKDTDIEALARSLEVYRPDGSPRPADEAPPLRALKGETVKNQEEIIRTPASGELRHRQVSSAPVKDAKGNIIGSVSVVRDITDRKRAEEALHKAHQELEIRIEERTRELSTANRDLKAGIAEREKAEEAVRAERQRFSEVLDKLPAYLVLLSPDYHVPFANRFFRERFGESHGKRCFEYLFNRTEPCETCETYTVLKTGQPHHWEWLGPDKRNYDIFDFPFTDSDGSTLIMEVGIDITERKRAEAELRQLNETLEQYVAERTSALRETSDYLNNLLDYANAPIIVWDPQLRITRFNHAFERLTGLGADEAIGQPLDILFPEDSKAQSMDHIHKAVSGERWETVEIPILHKDGSVRIVLWNSATLHAADGKTAIATIAQGQDITLRKRTEDALRDREAEVSAILETTPMLMLLVDSERRVVKSNKAAAQFANRRIEEMVGLRSGVALRCLHSMDDPRGCGFGPACQTCLTRLTVEDTINTGNSHYQVECKLPFGHGPQPEDTTFLLYTFPLELAQPALKRTLVCIQDVTALKKSEEEIRRLNEDLRQRATELEVANKELESFSYSVSHDLRAPLRSMEGFSQALLEDYADKLDVQGKDYLTRVRKSSELMAELIDDILELSRVTRSDMQWQTADLSEIAESICSELCSAQPQRAVEFEIAPGLTAAGDQKLLRVMLRNLLDNAWKFTAKAPVARIELGTMEYNGRKAYFVRDNGAGFDMTYAGKLFTAFQRLHSNDEFPGSGIGLATVQRIVRRHGGQVWAEGEVGKGATFYFTLGQ